MVSSPRFTLRSLLPLVSSLALLLFSWLVAGCGSGSNPISVSVTPSGAQALDLGQTFNITVTIAHDSQNKGATFALTGVGALSSQTVTSATYTAPTSGTGGTATLTVTSAADTSKSATINITVTAPPKITTTSLAASTEGSAYNQSVVVAGGAGALTYSVSTGSLPAGLTLNSSSGAITGTPTGPNGSVNFTVKVTDASAAGAQSATQALSLSVNLPPAPQISTTSLPADVEGTAYSQALAVTGGLAPFTYSISSGSLPAGLALAAAGTISGTPTGPTGTANFTLKVTDSSNPAQSATQALSIATNLPPAPHITTTSLPGATEFSSYSQSIAATGYALLAYSISSGSLPAGLAINSSTGAITGSPTGPNGTANFTVKVTDNSNPTQSATQALGIAVSLPAAPAITTTSLPNAIVGGNYSQAISFTGGHPPFTWSISSGTLPANLGINASTGAISGTAGSTTGTSNFTVKLVDSSNPAQSATQALSISVVTGPLTVTPATLPTGALNEVYPNTNLGASGGAPPYTWSITSGSLPTGLNPLSSTGQISGTPTAAGTFNFTAQVKDSTNATATGNFSIVVNPALAISTTSLPGGTVGTPYPSTNLTATGGVTPYAWSISAGSLPAGLTLTSGAISGQPTTAGTVNFTVQVVDAAGGVRTAPLSIVVSPAPPLAISTSTLPAGTINTPYSNAQLSATGGVQPYTWSITSGALPTGMNPLSSSGLISGTPTATGTFNFTVQVTDSTTPTANTQTASLSITVNAVPPCVAEGHESMLNGQYAFVLKGFDSGTGTGETSPEPAVIGGVLTFNGSGKIASGAMDMNLNSGVQTNLAITTGSYGVGADQRGCMVITTSAGTQNFRFSLGNISSGVAATGHVVDFDVAGPFVVGTMRKQTTSAFGTGSGQVTGNYAFGVSAGQNTANGGGKFAAVGVFNFSAGSITGGEVDFNTNGQLDGNSANTNWPTSPVSINSGGTYTVSSTTGRGTFSFTPGGPSAVGGILYVVSSTELLVLTSDSQTTNSLWAGDLLQQSGAPYSANPLSGNYVGYDAGLGSASGRTDIIVLGPFTSGNNSFSFTQLRNDSGTFTSSSVSGATYSVSSTGRLSIQAGGGNHPPVLYLVSANAAFSLNSNGGVDEGFFQSQSSTAGPTGTYAFGNIDPQISNTGGNAGVAAFASPNINITSDDNGNGSLTAGGTQTLTFSVDSTGLGHIPSGCTVSATATTCQTFFYIISPTQAVVMDATSGNPKLTLADK
jgi:hypothetical protein